MLQERYDTCGEFFTKIRKTTIFEDTITTFISELKNIKGCYEEDQFIVNEKYKMAVYTRIAITSGGFNRKVRTIVANNESPSTAQKTKKEKKMSKKRKHWTINEKPDTVLSSRNCFRRISGFLNKPKFNDFTVIIAGGTYVHFHGLFLKKIKKPHCIKNRKNRVLIYDSNVIPTKPTKTFASLLDLLNIEDENKSKLIYNDASHRLFNPGGECVHLVLFEIFMVLKYNRNPFERKKLQLYKFST